MFRRAPALSARPRGVPSHRRPWLPGALFALLVLAVGTGTAGAVGVLSSAAPSSAAAEGAPATGGSARSGAPAAPPSPSAVSLPPAAAPATSPPAPSPPPPAPVPAQPPSPAPRATATTPAPSPAAPAPAAPEHLVAPQAAAERVVHAYVTGYSWYDNTPAGSVQVSDPVVHAQAGGAGTWADPVTVAVGHSMATGRDVLRWPAGTRFYLPSLQKYAIVEDTCGDGPDPQDEACSTGYPAGDSTWLDVWIDGRTASAGAAEDCASAITGSFDVIVAPLPNHPVSAGPVASSGGCQS